MRPLCVRVWHYEVQCSPDGQCVLNDLVCAFETTLNENSGIVLRVHQSGVMFFIYEVQVLKMCAW